MSNQFFGFNSTQEKTLRELFAASVGGTIDTADIANGAVTAPKIGNLAVGTAALAADAVTAAKLADNAVVNANVDAAAAIAASKIDVAVGTDGLAADDLQGALQTLATKLDNVNDWAIALATKLNADATVTDTDYDTDPQA
jgi:hypothetical protein